MGLYKLQSCRDRAKLNGGISLLHLPEDRYPKQLLTLGAHAQRGLR